jgi:hypothetical protein
MGKNALMYFPFWLSKPPPHFSEGENFIECVANHLFCSGYAVIRPCSSLQPQQDDFRPSYVNGIGKTTQVNKFIHSYQHHYTHIFWFHTGTQQQLESSYLLLARKLKLSHTSTDIAFEAINSFFKQTNQRILLIFDNVQSIEKIKDYLPEAHPKHLHILITTQNSHDVGFALNPCTESIAKQHINAVLLNCKAEEMVALAKKLDFFPLAIRYACYYIQQNNITIWDYLKIYHHYQKKLEKNEKIPPKYSYISGFITLYITMSQLTETSPLGIKFLYLCTNFFAEKIPMLLFFNGSKKETEETKETKETKETLQLLANYGLIELRDDISFSINSFSQEVLILLTSLQTQQECFKSTHLLLRDTFFQTDSFTTKHLLLLHLEALLIRVEQYSNQSSATDNQKLAIFDTLAEMYLQLKSLQQQSSDSMTVDTNNLLPSFKN